MGTPFNFKGNIKINKTRWKKFGDRDASDLRSSQKFARPRHSFHAVFEIVGVSLWRINSPFALTADSFLLMFFERR
jgi:hypothetical protein